MKEKTIDYRLRKKSNKPHPFVYSKLSVTQASMQLLLLLLLQVAALFITKSYASLLIILATVSGILIASVLHWLYFRTKDLSILTFLVQGLMLGLLLPQDFPPVTAFFIALFVFLIAEYIFVDGVNTWMNTVCFAAVLAWVIGRAFFPGSLLPAEMFSLKNPTVYLVQNGALPVYSFDSNITDFLNRRLLSPFNVNLPEGMISLLCDTRVAIPAFRFNLLTLLASIVLFSTETFSLIIPSIFLFVYALLVRLFFPFMAGGDFAQGDIFLAICTNGTLFTAEFLLQWFGSHPVTLIGRVIYGLFAGILAFILVGCAGSAIGMFYMVLICNVLNLLIRTVEEHNKEGSINKLVGSLLQGMEPGSAR